MARAPAPQMLAAAPSSGPFRKAGWLPGSTAPPYLDGTLPGDVGFDPYCLVALARTGTNVGSRSWTNVNREIQMTMMTDYERKRKVAWMREAEIKRAPCE